MYVHSTASTPVSISARHCVIYCSSPPFKHAWATFKRTWLHCTVTGQARSSLYYLLILVIIAEAPTFQKQPSVCFWRWWLLFLGIWSHNVSTVAIAWLKFWSLWKRLAQCWVTNKLGICLVYSSSVFTYWVIPEKSIICLKPQIIFTAFQTLASWSSIDTLSVHSSG